MKKSSSKINFLQNIKNFFKNLIQFLFFIKVFYKFSKNQINIISIFNFFIFLNFKLNRNFDQQNLIKKHYDQLNKNF